MSSPPEQDANRNHSSSISRLPRLTPFSVAMYDQVLTGWLQKQGERGLILGWKRRWFFLLDEILYYYKNQDTDTKNSLGSIPMSSVLSVSMVEDNLGLSRATSWVFQLVTRKRTYYLRADDEREMQYWVNGIRKILMNVRDSKSQDEELARLRAKIQETEQLSAARAKLVEDATKKLGQLLNENQSLKQESKQNKELMIQLQDEISVAGAKARRLAEEQESRRKLVEYIAAVEAPQTAKANAVPLSTEEQLAAANSKILVLKKVLGNAQQHLQVSIGDIDQLLMEARADTLSKEHGDEKLQKREKQLRELVERLRRNDEQLKLRDKQLALLRAENRALEEELRLTTSLLSALDERSSRPRSPSPAPLAQPQEEGAKRQSPQVENLKSQVEQAAQHRHSRQIKDLDESSLYEFEPDPALEAILAKCGAATQTSLRPANVVSDG